MPHQKNRQAPSALCLIGSITALLSSLAAPGLAQDSYPSRAIRIVVPYAAGGAYIRRMSNYCDGCRYRPDARTGADACPSISGP